MTLSEPELADVPLLTVLQALADENRLAIVRGLTSGEEQRCGSFLPYRPPRRRWPCSWSGASPAYSTR